MFFAVMSRFHNCFPEFITILQPIFYIFSLFSMVFFLLSITSLYVCTIREVAGKDPMWYQGEEVKPLRPGGVGCRLPSDIWMKTCATLQNGSVAIKQTPYEYFVTVLLGLTLCEGARTLKRSSPLNLAVKKRAKME